MCADHQAVAPCTGCVMLSRPGKLCLLGSVWPWQQEQGNLKSLAYLRFGVTSALLISTTLLFVFFATLATFATPYYCHRIARVKLGPRRHVLMIFASSRRRS